MSMRCTYAKAIYPCFYCVQASKVDLEPIFKIKTVILRLYNLASKVKCVQASKVDLVPICKRTVLGSYQPEVKAIY